MSGGSGRANGGSFGPSDYGGRAAEVKPSREKRSPLAVAGRPAQLLAA